MNIRFVLKLVGRIELIVAATMCLPLAVALLYGESPLPFLCSQAVMLCICLPLACLPAQPTFFQREGFATVGLIWIVTCLFGSLPFCFSGCFASFLDCLFEASSGFTTTGATMRELKKRLAKILIERSYREGDFTLASGRKSDYYFDCRQTALHPEGSWLIGTLFNELLADLDIKGIGGMTLGADPLISATTVISHEKGRPLAGLIVRKESKGHGTNQYVEGLSNFKPGDPVAMVEDVVTTGGSLLKACERVKDAGLNVVAVCTVLDRGEGGREAIEAAGYQLRALFTRPELVELAKED